MADDTLRIVAKVEDQFTGPLAKLKGELKGVGDETAKHGSTWKKEWAGARQEVDKFKGVLGGFSPILASIGFGGMGAALSLAGIGGALKGFTSSTRDLSLMGKQIGMTVDQLRDFGALGGKVGVSADTMGSAIGHLADNARDLRNRWGSVYGELRNMNLGKALEDVISAPNMQAMAERAMQMIQSIPDNMVAARVSTLFFGTPDVAKVVRNLGVKVGEGLKQVHEQIGSISEEAEKNALRFEASSSRIWNAYERLKNAAISPMLGGAAGALEAMADSAELDPNDPKSRLRYLKKQKDDLDTRLKELPEGSWKRGYYENNRNGVDAEIKKLEEAISRGAEKGVDKALGKRGPDGATVQKQSWGGSGPFGAGNGSGSGGTGSLIQQAAWGGPGMGMGSDPWAGMRARYPIPSYGSGPLGGGGGGGRGGGGGGKDGPMPAIPDNVKMSDEERNTLGLILKYESHGKNTMNYVGASQGLDPSAAKGYTAQGYFQILNSNWRRLAPGLGIKARNAMAATLEEQARVALALLRKAGGRPRDWAPFNPALRAAIARGERVPVAAIPKVAPSGEAAVPPGDENGNFPNGAPRALKPKSMADDPSVPGQVVGDPKPSAREQWDDQFSRRGKAGGGRAMQLPDDTPGKGKGRLDIHLHGFPEGSRTKATLDGLFDEHSVSRRRSQMDMDRA